MRVLKLKAFARWARKEGLTDRVLQRAVCEMQSGLVEASLGGGLFKKRIARPGGGKSGGYRTLVAADLRDRWVFLYGFAKSRRDDFEEAEIHDWKRVAQSYLALSDGVLDRFVDAGQVMEVQDGESTNS